MKRVFAVAVLAVLMVFMAVAPASAACESPDVDLVRMTDYKLVVDPGGIFNKARLYVNNEYKRYRVNDKGHLVYRSEFIIHYANARVTNDCGLTFKEFYR
jgi:hypothetical protein